MGMPHFLVVTFPFQGHINPAVRLASRLAARRPAPHVTFSTTISGHRRMFPSGGDAPASVGPVTFAPFSDGGGDADPHPRDFFHEFMATFKEAVYRGVLGLIDAFSAAGKPVSCVLYTVLVPWAADAARSRGVPAAHYWIQPASVFAVYYHYFHGHRSLVDDNAKDSSFVVQLPGLAPMRIRDLPSLVFASGDTDKFHSIYLALRDGFQSLDADGSAATVIINTFQELEPEPLAGLRGTYQVLPVGPLLPPAGEQGGNVGSIFQADEEKSYMDWLDTKPGKSVVYVAFGSLSAGERDRLSSLHAALEECGRPYLWVVRKDQMANCTELDAKVVNGRIVEWCDQVKVLGHPSVGCFVTHCGWNSVLEGLAAGVPMVGVPLLSDQMSNAKLVEECGVGVRADIAVEGPVNKEELVGCIAAVMGGGEGAAELRHQAAKWRATTWAALAEGGSSDRNLTAFVAGVCN